MAKTKEEEALEKVKENAPAPSVYKNLKELDPQVAAMPEQTVENQQFSPENKKIVDEYTSKVEEYIKNRDTVDKNKTLLNQRDVALDQLGELHKNGKLDNEQIQALLKLSYPQYSQKDREQMLELVPKREERKDMLRKQASGTQMTEEEKIENDKYMINDPGKYQNSLINFGSMVLNAMYSTGKSKAGGDWNPFTGMAETKDKNDENALKQKEIDAKKKEGLQKKVDVDKDGNIVPPGSPEATHYAWATDAQIANAKETGTQLIPRGLNKVNEHQALVNQSVEGANRKADYRFVISKQLDDYQQSNNMLFSTWKSELDIKTGGREKMVTYMKDMDDKALEVKTRIDTYDKMSNALNELEDAAALLEKYDVTGYVGYKLSELNAALGGNKEKELAVSRYNTAVSNMRPYARQYANEKGAMSNQDQAAIAKISDFRYLAPEIRKELYKNVNEFVSDRKLLENTNLNRVYENKIEYQKILSGEKSLTDKPTITPNPTNTTKPKDKEVGKTTSGKSIYKDSKGEYILDDKGTKLYRGG